MYSQGQGSACVIQDQANGWPDLEMEARPGDGGEGKEYQAMEWKAIHGTKGLRLKPNGKEGRLYGWVGLVADRIRPAWQAMIQIHIDSPPTYVFIRLIQ